MGHPRATASKRIITRMTPELLKKIDRQAKRERLARSGLIRSVLERYLTDRDIERSYETGQEK